MSIGSELDAARAEVVERGLTADAIAALSALVSGFSLEALGPVKQQLKRYFSAEPWTAEDDDHLAAAIEHGDATRTTSAAADSIDDGSVELAPGLRLLWSRPRGAFRLRVESERRPHGGSGDRANAVERTPDASEDLGATFDGVVVPEATPSPRTIRFATPQLGTGPSRAYGSETDAAEEPRAARLFRQFADVTNVLVGPDFVAVTASRPDRWESLLVPVLRAVTEEFTDREWSIDASKSAVAPPAVGGSANDAPLRGESRLDRAWAELGGLRADRPADLARVLTAADDTDAVHRQVAAVLLADAPPEDAARAWGRLLEDSSRTVRRAAVDTMADAAANRADLRPLFERALDDSDAWVRWKALRGIEAMGGEPSRARLEALAADPDFRVRLDAGRITAALR